MEGNEVAAGEVQEGRVERRKMAKVCGARCSFVRECYKLLQV